MCAEFAAQMHGRAVPPLHLGFLSCESHTAGALPRCLTLLIITRRDQFSFAHELWCLGFLPACDLRLKRHLQLGRGETSLCGAMELDDLGSNPACATNLHWSCWAHHSRA